MIALLLTPHVVVWTVAIVVAVTFAAAAVAALLSPAAPLGCGRHGCRTCARVAGAMGDDNDSPVAGDVASDTSDTEAP